MGSGYLFFLGLASGVALLAMSAYRRVSPRWLKWALMASGLLVISRYVTLALFTADDAPQRFWALRHCWFGSAIGLAFPSVFAVDQLVRHPAMTPKKLLTWVVPFLVAFGAIMIFGDFTAARDPVAGWALHLNRPWRVVAAGVEAVFVIGFIGMCGLVMHKIPVRSIRLALLGLIAGYAYLGLDGLILALGGWYFRPFLYSEMATLFALWHAYETSHSD